jgi:hypothetical protein
MSSSLVGAVGVGADEINSSVDEKWVYCVARLDLRQRLAHDGEHPLDEAVLYHKWPARLHLFLSRGILFANEELLRLQAGAKSR